MVHGDVEWVYLIKPANGQEHAKNNGSELFAGEPVVAVYDWCAYTFEGADPNKLEPTPVTCVSFSQVRKTGLEWQRPAAI